MAATARIIAPSNAEQALGFSTVRYLKVLTSHAAHARFLAECAGAGPDAYDPPMEIPVREIPRIKEIPSPYAYAPTHSVWRWQGREVIIVETRHRRYEVWEVLS